MVVGPLRSTVSEASALLLGVRNTPQVSYGSSSPTLSDTSLYPRFFRTFPSDASAATTICQLLSDQLDLAQVGVFYSSDTYGEGYMKALQSDCSALGVEVQGWAYEIGNHQSIRTVMSNLEASAVSVVIFVFLDTADLAMLIEAGLELQSLGKSKPRLLVLPEALDLDSLSSAAREVLHGSLALRSIGGTTANPRWAAFASQGWYNLNASAFNQLLPEPFHMNQSIFGPTFDASNSYYLRNLGTYEYDAMAAVGLLACQVAPSGALPADFGTQLWNAATSADFEFEGLSGVVRFDERGDRDQLTANIQLYNVLQAADGSLSESQVASYDGTKAVPWGWQGGSMSASGVVFNGGKASPPRMVRVALLQRLSDARMISAELCGGAAGNWLDGTCWLGEGWQAVSAAGLAAVNDFNARSGSYVPQFASEAMQACDVQLSVSVIDSGSISTVTMGALTTRLFTPAAPDVVVGPARSEVAQQAATLLGTDAIDTLQISYWASSPKLSDTSMYPRFMRTYPTDEATAVALCDFWKTTMGCADSPASPRLILALRALVRIAPKLELSHSHSPRFAGSQMLPQFISMMPLAKATRRVSSRRACIRKSTCRRFRICVVTWPRLRVKSSAWRILQSALSLSSRLTIVKLPTSLLPPLLKAPHWGLGSRVGGSSTISAAALPAYPNTRSQPSTAPHRSSRLEL